MGQETLYCHRCGNKLQSTDFTRGRALTIENRSYCLSCVPRENPLPAGTPNEKPGALPHSTPQAFRRVSAQGPKDSEGTKGLWIALPLGGVVVLAFLISIFRGGGAPREPQSASSAVGRPPAPLPSGEGAAALALRKARDFSDGRPTDVGREIELWQRAVLASENTGYAQEARSGLRRAQARVREGWAEEARQLEDRLSVALGGEQFGAALGLLEEGRKRHEHPDWVLPLDKRKAAILAQAKELYPSLRQKATAAKSTSAFVELADIRRRVEGWGLPEFLQTLERDVAATPEALRAGASEGIVTVLLGKSIKRDFEQVRADQGAYGPKQDYDPATNETHVYLPYGQGNFYHESVGVIHHDARRGASAQFVSAENDSNARVTYRLNFDVPITAFRLRCGWCEIAPCGTSVAGVEYSSNSRDWTTVCEYKESGKGGLRILECMVPGFEAKGLRTRSLDVRFYTRDKSNPLASRGPGRWLRLRNSGDLGWGDAAQTFAASQVQLWVKPAGNE